MMSYNFDEIIERKGTNSLKYDTLKRVFGTEDVLPLWVADMDFRTPDFIIKALKKRLEHEILGYTIKTPGFYNSVTGWMKRRFGWEIESDWISFTPGVVSALNFGVLGFTELGDKVIIQTPVYAPFFTAVKDHGRQLVLNPLKLNDGRYEMDLDDLEAQIDKHTKVLILCNPHNPAGRVWLKDELLALGEICLKHNIIIISDEIHSDLIMPGHRHIPMASLSDELANITVTTMAPSKTFNIAGLASSVIITSNSELRRKFEKLPNSCHLGNGNLFGLAALEAAYTHGDQWLEELLVYLDGNLDLVETYLEKIPQIKLIRPEGTYLAFLDCREMNLPQAELRKFFIEKARVGLNNGTDFGPNGEGFMRINVGCPRSILAEGMERIKKAVSL
ncbi:MAG: PatB family C-S lyase [Bacteroidota bacterium]|nr:PatB family C-S lyase [Bacteroidota bacterium]